MKEFNGKVAAFWGQEMDYSQYYWEGVIGMCSGCSGEEFEREQDASFGCCSPLMAPIFGSGTAKRRKGYQTRVEKPARDRQAKQMRISARADAIATRVYYTLEDRTLGNGCANSLRTLDSRAEPAEVMVSRHEIVEVYLGCEIGGGGRCTGKQHVISAPRISEGMFVRVKSNLRRLLLSSFDGGTE